MNYGRGRMEQAIVEMQWKTKISDKTTQQKTSSLTRAISNSFFLAPFIFSLYIILLPITVWYSELVLIPLVLYVILSIISAGGFALKEKKPILLFLLPAIYIIMHFAYSCGLIWALLRRINKQTEEHKPVEVNIRIVKTFQGV